jgi:hypothetical protein
LEEFRELQSRAYRDRKVLWHKLNRLITNPESVKFLVESPPSPSSKKDVVQETPSAPTQPDRTADSQDTTETTQPKTTWKNSQVSAKKLTDSDFLFQFDDEEPYDTKSEPEEAVAEPDDSDDVDFEDFYDPRPSSFQIASSVPVSIPAQFAALGAEKPKFDTKPDINQASTLQVNLTDHF